VSPSDASLNVVKNATCTFCGCVCDDIELHADGDRIVKAKNACSLGDAWFKHHTAERAFPDALIDGQPASLDAAIQAAADYLYDANMPLVYGLSNVTCEAQREAVALAESIGGVIDSHTSL
jgi:formylmethanofuran dehydrogenase subunit B